MNKKRFLWLRFSAKIIGMIFALAGVLLFMINFVPLYVNKISLVIFIIGGFLWALDTVWSTIDDVKELANEISKNGRRRNTAPVTPPN